MCGLWTATSYGIATGIAKPLEAALQVALAWTRATEQPRSLLVPKLRGVPWSCIVEHDATCRDSLP